MKVLFGLCFLVLVFPLSQSQTMTTVSSDNKKQEQNKTTEKENHTEPEEVPDPSADSKTLYETSVNNSMSMIPNVTSPSYPAVVSGSQGEETTGTINGSYPVPTKKVISSPATTAGVMNKTIISSTTPAPASNSSKAGYVILVLIIIVIIILCIILYMLRRASRTYSFDLQRPAPATHLDEPTGTFGAVYLDDFDRPNPNNIVTTEDLPTTPVSNGTSPPLEEKGSSGENREENVTQEQPEANGVKNSPSRSSSSSSSSDRSEGASNQLNNDQLNLDAAEEQQQNENNNNSPSVHYSDPFVEINLDEPAWCDQIFPPAQPPSSVYPFSFSSSS